MIQDIEPHIYQNEYRAEEPDEESFLLYFSEGKALARWEDTALLFPQFKDYPEVRKKLSDKLVYLFAIDGLRFYLARELAAPERRGYQLRSVREFREAQPQWVAFAGITAHQLSHWYDSHIFCGHCGCPMKHASDARMLRCPDCGQEEYPKISPAVIVGILHEEKLLMSKYAGRTITHYALIAGFNEIGETLEETVKREVFEETGLHVKNIRYYKSQPWSFSETILMGFFADLDGTDEITLDTRELSTADWFTREEAPAQSLNISLTSEMIWEFKRGRV